MTHRQNTWLWATRWVEVGWHLLLQRLTAHLQMLLFPVCVFVLYLFSQTHSPTSCPAEALQTLSLSPPCRIGSGSAKETTQAGQWKPEERGHRVFLPHSLQALVLSLPGATFSHNMAAAQQSHLSPTPTGLRHTLPHPQSLQAKGWDLSSVVLVSVCLDILPQVP